MNPSNTLPKIGDRVRITSDDMFNGRVGTVVQTIPSGRASWVRVDDGEPLFCLTTDLISAEPISQPARMLLAAWHASGRTLERVNLHTSNYGWETRRYCTPDRTVDLTITTKVAS